MGASGPERNAVDVSGLRADVTTLDALARLALCARLRGRRLELRGLSPELRELIALAGLEEALCGSGLEARRKPQELEEPLGLEEEGELPDPPV